MTLRLTFPVVATRQYFLDFLGENVEAVSVTSTGAYHPAYGPENEWARVRWRRAHYFTFGQTG